MKKEGLFVIIQETPTILAIPLADVLEVRVQRNINELFTKEERKLYQHCELNTCERIQKNHEIYAVIYKEVSSPSPIAITTATMPFIVEASPDRKLLKVGLEYKVYELFRHSSQEETSA